MTRLLIGSLRLEHWYTEEDYPWLPAGGVIADALKDLRPSNGTLSVFEIPAPEDIALIRRIVTAIAAGQQNPRTVGFLLFERTAVEDLGIAINGNVPGDTGHLQADPLHRDLEQLSALRLAELAGLMAHGDEDELQPGTLREILAGELQAQRMDVYKVSNGLREELGLL